MSYIYKIGEYVRNTFLENPIPRGAVYAFGYIAKHNDVEACMHLTYMIIGIEGVLGGLKFCKQKEEDLLEKILAEREEFTEENE